MRVCQRTHQGLVRSSNQDCLLVDGCVYGVADGMGGHQGGETASRVAVQVLKNALRGKLPDRRALEVGVEAANRRVYDMARHDSSLSGMGTTVTLIWEDGKRVLVGHVGDSRAYHITPAGITRITKDHSLVESMVDRGDITAEEARRHPSRNLITRALGPDISADCDGFLCPMKPGDYVLLCSDGLVNTVTDQEMLFEVIHGDGPDTCLDRLLAIARRQGAPDNVTAVLMRME